MDIYARIKELGICLPASSEPKAMYIPVVRTGNLLYISGQIPMVEDKLLYTGKLGQELSLEQGSEAARVCAVNIIAALQNYLGDLKKVKKFVKIQAFISSAPGFYSQHIVANAVSQLLYDVFGDCGSHARTAVSVNQLPMDAPVEIEAIVECLD